MTKVKSKSKSNSSDRHRQQKVIALASRLLREYADVPADIRTYLDLRIDSEFYFIFDNGWNRDVVRVREEFLGRADPLPNKAAVEAFYKRKNQEDDANYPAHPWLLQLTDGIRRLARAHGVIDEGQVVDHVLLGSPVYWPYIDDPTLDVGWHGLPVIVVHFHSIHAVRLLERMPFLRVSEGAYHGMWEEAKTALLDSGERRKVRQKGTSWENRIRTWAIYLLSREGGGGLLQYQAVEQWNYAHPSLAISPTTYPEQKRAVIGKVQKHVEGAKRIYSEIEQAIAAARSGD